MHLSRIFLKFFIGAGFLLSIPAAFASGIGISPLKYELTIEAGKETSALIKVTNSSPTSVTLYTSKEDFIAGDDSGTPSFIKKESATTDEYTLSSWITLEEGNFTLAKGESREVRFKVRPPKNAEPGGHYGAIFFSPGTPENSQVAVVQRLGVLILVNVPGEVTIDGGLSSFVIGSRDESQKFMEKTNFSSFPIVFQSRFKNNGNIHLKPVGKIELTDEDGNLLKNIGKEALTAPTGAYIGDKMVDYIPVNDILGSVLPKSERRYDSVWEGFGYLVLNEDGTKTVKFKNLSEYYADQANEKRQFLKFYESVHSRNVTKKIHAKLSLSYEGKDKIRKDFNEGKDFVVEYTEQYVGMNYTVIAGVILLILGLIWYIKIYLPASKERLRKSLLEELEGKSPRTSSKK